MTTPRDSHVEILQSKIRLLSEDLLRKDAEIDRLKRGIRSDLLRDEFIVELSETINYLQSVINSLKAGAKCK